MCLGRRNRRGRVEPLLEQGCHIALNGFELMQLEIRVQNRKQIPRARLLVNENSLAFPHNLFFHFEKPFPLQHDRQDEGGGDITGIVQFD